MDLRIAKFGIERERDVSLVAQRARLLASLAGLSSQRRSGLGRALAEVARNAVVYADGGTVEFRLRGDGRQQWLEASVRDRGPGIADPKRLLSEDPSSNPQHKAPSGLMRAKGWVDRISLHSKPHEGTVVCIGQTLPPGGPPLGEAIAADWSAVLAHKSPRNALVSSHRRILELDSELSAVRQRDADLQRELQDLKSLNDTLSLLALVASKTENAVFILDEHGQIEWVNDGFVRMTGHELREVVGKPPGPFLHGPQTDLEAIQEIDDALRNEHGLSLDLLHCRKDGRTYWASTSLTPVLDDAGKLARWVGMFSDSTRRRQAHEALEAAKEAAEAASRAKSEFLANMSHEIRTPMNAIIGMTELALGTTLTPEQREYLLTVKQSSEALLRLLNDILDLSKIEAGKFEIESVSFSLADVLRETMKVLSVRAAKKGLELAWHLPPEVPKQLMGDPARLRQILFNLVGNAIKFTKKGEVVVRIEPQWQTETEIALHFAVADTGIGIPAEKLQQIFEAFMQVDSSTSRRFGGTGLGLTISSQLIELMGGRIWVQSKVGKGSTFHFSLRFALPETTVANPVPEKKSGKRAATPSRQLAAPRRILRVLVADDNAANRVLAARVLQKRGHDIVSVASGREVLSALKQQSFDVVLLDVQMPKMDGFATTAAIRESERHTGHHIPIVAMTAYAMSGDRERCLDAGMDAYMAKPLHARQLQKLVESLAADSPAESADPAASPMPPTAFDFAPALARLEGDVELLKEQMRFFLQDTPALLSDIAGAIARCDGKQLQLSAHRLKGLVSSFDDRQSSEATQRLERMGRSEDFADAGALFEQLHRDLNRLGHAIEAFLEQDPASSSLSG